MNEKTYKKRLDFQQKMISRQSEQIELLKSQVEKLKLELKEKDKIIDSVTPLKNELISNIEDAKKYKKESKNLIQELRKMKDIVNQEVYGGRWKLIKYLMR